MPWDGVFERLTSGEKTFWEKSLEKPGFRITIGNASPQAYVEGDAPTAQPTNETTGYGGRPLKHPRGTATVTPHVPAPPQPTGPTPRRPGKAKEARTQKEDKSVWDGSKYLKNRNGACVCKGFQSGQCNRLNSWSLCSQDGYSCHQCELCLQVGHGSHEAAKCPKQGKGAGRRGGKTGKGGRR